jgi:molybdate transport system permease protein
MISSYEKIPQLTLLTAASLGANARDRFFTVILPMSRRATLAAAALAFAHTMGEFGIVLMIGGNIPGETQVLSIALFDHVESLEYGKAHSIAAILLVLSFFSLLCIYNLDRQSNFRINRARN